MARARGNAKYVPPKLVVSRTIGERSCCVCRARRPKKELVRFARPEPGRVVFDPAGTAPGRGGYICSSVTCLDLALARGSLARALKTALSAEQQAALRRECVGYLGVENEY